MSKLKVIISGGGTGGHIFPALSIAREIKSREPLAEILFVGAHNRMEMEKVPAAGYEIIGLPVSGFQRSLSLKNLSFFPKLFISLAKCKSIIREFKPDVVVGVGGFASGPLLRKAQRMNVPTLIQEQNSYAGLTNKLLAKKAKRICVAYNKMDKFFPKDKIINTGNPIRKDLLTLKDKSSEAMSYFNLDPNKKTLLVVGGSLGARTINQSIAFNLDELIRKDIQVIWQTGKNYITQAKQEINNYSTRHGVQAYDFISRMDLAYSAADFIISRAGAGTISELCVVAKPVVLVPSPNVAEDHQTKNALALFEIGAALMVADKDAMEELVSTLLSLMDDEEKQKKMKVGLKETAKPNADSLIVDEIFKLI